MILEFIQSAFSIIIYFSIAIWKIIQSIGIWEITQTSAIIFSLIISYYIYFAPGKIEVLPPRMCYFQHVVDTKHRPSVVLPLTFVNEGARTASVLDVKLKVKFKPASEQGKKHKQEVNLTFVLVREYEGYPNPTKENMAAQFSVRGHENISKTFDFRLSNEDLEKLQQFEAGEYTIEVEMDVQKKGLWKSSLEMLQPNFCIVVKLNNDLQKDREGCTLSPVRENYKKYAEHCPSKRIILKCNNNKK